MKNKYKDGVVSSRLRTCSFSWNSYTSDQTPKSSAKAKAKMAPKKKQQQQQQKQKQNSNNTKSNSKSQNSSSSSSSSSGPRLQISAENENRLRRLLLNNSNNSARSDSAPVDDTLSKAQKAKKLKTVYEKLSCEGFTNDQIELALSALKVALISLSLCLVSEKIK